MLLATRCPYCRTTFRVVQDQLKICNGIVRCGSCRQVFNGIEQLQRADAAALAQSEPAQEPTAWPASADINPVTIVGEAPEKSDFVEAHEDLNLVLAPAEMSFQHTTPLADTPDPVYHEPLAEHDAPAPEPEEPEPDLILHIDERKEPQLGDAAFLSAAAPSESPSMPLPVTPSAPMPIDEDEPAYKVELRSQTAEPAFVQRARRQERYGRLARIGMALLVLLMLPVLLLQVIDAFHQQLAASFPLVRPVVRQVCAVFDCQSELAAQIDAVSVDSSELHAPTGGEKAFALNLLLRNRSPLAQAWPHVELTLNDAEEKPVVRRVFTAAEYLDGSMDASKGFAAHSEQSLKLVFEVEPSLKPVGYRVYLFYP